MSSDMPREPLVRPGSLGHGRPYGYATSHPIEELVVDGRVLLRKDLRPEALLPEAKGCKPSVVSDPRREPAVYRELLAPVGLGPPLHDAGDEWVLVEQVAGVELWQIGDLTVWGEVAAWLPELHDRLTAQARAAPTVPLVQHDRGFYDLWLDRARPRLGRVGPVIADAHALAVDLAFSLPQGVIHGELYPSNVLVAGRGASLRVWPVDWEMAATAPLVMDLAALSAGWGVQARHRLVAAYAQASGWDDLDALVAGVDACRLLQSLQWLGWSERWEPPPEHRQDWLAVAAESAARIRPFA